MPDSRTESVETKPAPAHKFPTTQWSVVLEAGAGDLLLAAAALERLCCNYWHPVYAFVRYRGQSPHDAEDTTQSFFAFLLEKETLKKVDRQKGKFRSFLLAALNNFLTNQWDKQQVLKRGGGRKIVSLDDTGEAAYIKEPVDQLSPEKLFERHWAMTWWIMCFHVSGKNTRRANAPSYLPSWSLNSRANPALNFTRSGRPSWK